MDKNKPAICVFCGSSFGVNPRFREAAEALGHGIAAAGFDLVFGGGAPGLMGVVARAAREAGAGVEGILPDFLRAVEPPLVHGEITHIVPDLHVRKQQMMTRASGFAVLPGGLGTYDEFFEVVSSAQLDVHAKPVVVVNIDGYYNALDAMIRDAIAAGFVRKSNLELYRMADSVEATMAFLSAQIPTPAR